MKYQLNFAERYAILLLLQGWQHASIQEWSIINAAKEELKITKEHIKALKIQAIPNGIVWDEQKGQEIYAFDLDEKLINMIKEKITILDKKKMIPKDLMPLVYKLELQ